MRVLFVCPYPVWPPTHGGRVRVAGLARGLAAAGADVTVLSPWHPRQPRRALGPAVEHHTHLLPSSALTALASRVAPGQALLSLEPSFIPRRLLRSLGTFDVVQFDFCAQAAWMDLLPGDPAIVYSAHNVEREFFENEAHRYLLRRRPAHRLESLERAAVQRADLVVTCSERDALRLDELYGARRTAVVPNGCLPDLAGIRRAHIRDRARAALGAEPGERVAVFVGGGAEHNREAAVFLARSVAPRLRGRTRIVLAGASAAAARPATGVPVHNLGYVTDLGSLLAAADVGLNPVARSSGASVKVADYLGSGLGVLATEAGARGLDHLRAQVRVVPRERFAEELESDAGPPALGSALTWTELGQRLHTRFAAI